MNNYIKITLGHYNSALESERIHKDHTPTYFQAMLTTIIDLVTFGRNHIYDKNTGAFIVYDVIRKPLYNVSIAQIHSVYCPKEFRGKNSIHNLLHKIPYSVVVCDHNVGGSNEVGRFYAYSPSIYKV